MELTGTGDLKLTFTAILDLNCISSYSVLEKKQNLFFFDLIQYPESKIYSKDKNSGENLKSAIKNKNFSKDESEFCIKSNRKTRKQKKTKNQKLDVFKVKGDKRKNQNRDKPQAEYEERNDSQKIYRNQKSIFDSDSVADLRIALFNETKRNNSKIVFFDILSFNTENRDNKSGFDFKSTLNLK